MYERYDANINRLLQGWQYVFKVDDELVFTSVRLNIIFGLDTMETSPQSILADLFNRFNSIKDATFNLKVLMSHVYSHQEHNAAEARLSDIQRQCYTVSKTMEMFENLITCHDNLRNVAFDAQTEYETGSAYDTIMALGNGEILQMENEQGGRKGAQITDYDRLYAKFVSWIKKKNLRKIGDRVYRPAFNEQGQKVYAFEMHPDFKDIETLVGHIPTLFTDWETFHSLLSNGAISKLILHLKTMETIFFPTLKKDRYTLAFSNGLYSLRILQFYPLSSRTLPPHFNPAKYSAVKYHRINYKEAEIQQQKQNFLRTNPSDPSLWFMHIELSPFRKVLTHQGYDMDEMFFIFAMLGRVLYEQNYRLDKNDKFGDNFESELWFEGVAQSGKSTMMKWIQEVVDINDVGVISNQVEKNFPLQGCIDRLFYMVYEMNENFNLDQMILQNMISGEMINIAIKNQSPVITKWNMHGCFASNNIPDFKDNQNSMGRRFCVVSHQKPVEERNEKLLQSGVDRIDFFITIISSAYHELLRRSYVADGGFRSLIPKKIIENTKRVMSQCNPVRGFIESKCLRFDGPIDVKTMDPQFITHMSDFRQAYEAYEKEYNIGSKSMKLSERFNTIRSLGFIIDSSGPTQEVLIYGLKLNV